MLSLLAQLGSRLPFFIISTMPWVAYDNNKKYSLYNENEVYGWDFKYARICSVMTNTKENEVWRWKSVSSWIDSSKRIWHWIERLEGKKLWFSHSGSSLAILLFCFCSNQWDYKRIEMIIHQQKHMNSAHRISAYRCRTVTPNFAKDGNVSEERNT